MTSHTIKNYFMLFDGVTELIGGMSQNSPKITLHIFETCQYFYSIFPFIPIEQISKI